MTKVIVATNGSYSDYSVVAVIEWLKGTPEKARDKWLDLHPEQAKEYSFETSMFVAWLVSEGYAQDLVAEELHISDYGTITNGWSLEILERYRPETT